MMTYDEIMKTLEKMYKLSMFETDPLTVRFREFVKANIDLINHQNVEIERLEAKIKEMEEREIFQEANDYA